MAKNYTKVIEVAPTDIVKMIDYQRSLYDNIFKKKETNSATIENYIKTYSTITSIVSLLMIPGLGATALGISSLITSLLPTDPMKVGSLVNDGCAGLAETRLFFDRYTQFDKIKVNVGILEYPEHRGICFVTSKVNSIIAAKYKGSSNWTNM